MFKQTSDATGHVTSPAPKRFFTFLQASVALCLAMWSAKPLSSNHVRSLDQTLECKRCHSDVLKPSADFSRVEAGRSESWVVEEGCALGRFKPLMRYNIPSWLGHFWRLRRANWQCYISIHSPFKLMVQNGFVDSQCKTFPPPTPHITKPLGPP